METYKARFGSLAGELFVPGSIQKMGRFGQIL
jgi:hypothetical protein